MNTKVAIARLNVVSFRCFGALNIRSIKREEVLATKDFKWLGNYVQAVVETNDANGADAVNEYFRKNFRKVTTKQALDVVSALAEKAEAPFACLDGKFWVWESLEEALRGEVENLSFEDYISTMKVF